MNNKRQTIHSHGASVWDFSLRTLRFMVISEHAGLGERQFIQLIIATCTL
ncbi:hypothetical protein [Pseudomonas alloputida]|nr:hypothetical protein [Pseudomonas alloputida]